MQRMSLVMFSMMNRSSYRSGFTIYGEGHALYDPLLNMESGEFSHDAYFNADR